MPERMRQTVMAGIGLFTITLGCRMSLASDAPVIVLCSLIVGGIAGELLDLDGLLKRLGDRLGRRQSDDGESAKFSKGFVTASLVFCAGPLTVIGCILDGVAGDSQPLILKSVLDGFTAIVLSATLGLGVAFSSVTVLIFQGGISLLAMFAASRLGGISETTPQLVEFGATGGVLIVAIGIVILDLKPIRVANFIPAMILAPLLTSICRFFDVTF